MNTLRKIQYIKQLLRNVAEVDPDDDIANRASQLAVELETLGKINELSEMEKALVRYAYSKRKVYVFSSNDRHAVNLEKETV